MTFQVNIEVFSNYQKLIQYLVDLDIPYTINDNILDFGSNTYRNASIAIGFSDEELNDEQLIKNLLKIGKLKNNKVRQFIDKNYENTNKYDIRYILCFDPNSVSIHYALSTHICNECLFNTIICDSTIMHGNFTILNFNISELKLLDISTRLHAYEYTNNLMKEKINFVDGIFFCRDLSNGIYCHVVEDNLPLDEKVTILRPNHLSVIICSVYESDNIINYLTTYLPKYIKT